MLSDTHLPKVLAGPLAALPATVRARPAGASMFLQGGAGRTRHYLTATDGGARYSMHMGWSMHMGRGPAAVSHFGTCQ